jgi:geranylgeranyl transferase type-1 subunit beta
MKDACQNGTLMRNRMTLACFCLSGLDLLGAIETDLTAEERQQYIEWIYAQQVHPSQIKGESAHNHLGIDE